MARQEVYTTVIKLNSEEAKNRLRELEDKVARLKKAKQEAFSTGDSRLGASLAKDLKAAEREMRQFKNSTMSVKETLDNLSSASLGQLEKAARHLKGQMKAASDPSDYAKLDAQLSQVKEQMLALKGATRKADEEAHRMTATLMNLKHASLDDLNFTAGKLKSQMNGFDPTSSMYASRATQLRQVEAELERIRQSQQRVVTLMQQYDREIESANVDIKETKRQTQLIHHTMANLKTSSVRDLEYSIKAINQQMSGLDRGSKEFKTMSEQARRLKTELQAVRAEGAAQQSWINRTADWFNRMQTIALGAVAAITGITMTVHKCIDEYAQMDDEMTNVRKYTGQTADEVERMNEDFKKMDTRTPRQKLNQLAEDAGRLGITSTAAIEEFVDGADKINVALGDDLGDEAVSQIGKLAQMFGEDKSKGLRGAMLATGSAVNELAQSSSAGAGYLVDFTARVAGVGKQAGMTQAQIMGLASVLDQNMQQDETAATAVQQLITKMFQDTSKFAQLAGIDTKKFAETLKTDANKALLQFLSAMKSKGGFSELAPMFEQMQLNGSRATGVLTVLADKLDDVQTAQRIATEAYAEGTSVLNEFNTQNESVQAQIDKARKRFSDLSIELGQKLYPAARLCISTASLSVRIISSLVDFIIQYKTTLLTLTVTIVALTVAETAHIAKLKAISIWQKTLVPGAKKLWAVLASHPYLALGAAIATVVALIVDMTKKTDSAAKAQKELNDIHEEAQREIVEEQMKLETLRKVAMNETRSLNERYAAIAELNKIVPNYNAQIDKTTGKYQENKQALDAYILSLVKLYEVQGAKKKIIELSEKRAGLVIKQHEAQDSYDSAKKAGPGYTYTTSWGAVGNTTQDAVGHFKAKLDEINGQIKEVDNIIKTINDVYGTDIQNQAVNDLKHVNGNGTGSGSGSGGGRPGKTGSGKNDDPNKARAEQLKKEYDQLMLMENLAYQKGEIDLRTHYLNMQKIDQGYINKRKNSFAQDTDYYKEALNDQMQLDADKIKHSQELNEKDIEVQRTITEAKLKAMYYDPQSDIYMSQEALNEALYMNELSALEDRLALYQQGSDEYLDISREIEEKEGQHKQEKAKEYEERKAEIVNTYHQMNADEMEAAELKELNDLYEKKVFTTEEYEALLAKIRAKYYTQRQDEKSSRRFDNGFDDKTKDIFEKGNVEDKVTGNQNSLLGATFGYISMFSQLKQARDKDLISQQEYQDAMSSMWDDLWKHLPEIATAALQTVSNGLAAYSAYSKACSDLEVATITKNYDKQISAAGNNSKKKKKLEEKRDKEIAAAKSKANKKAMKIEIAQALASTAMAAINAYASAAKTYWLLGPIAAAAATAAGMLQIATIKKQHQAEAAGYYEGGYTGGNRYRREAGVVHEGEFVANHNAVNNSSIRPALDLIDRAQRTNTVGSLTAEDITRSLGQGGGAVVAPIVNVTNDNAEVRQSLDGVNAAVSRLSQTLDDGIEVEVPITGRNGLHRRLRDYQRMLDNK